MEIGIDGLNCKALKSFGIMYQYRLLKNGIRMYHLFLWIVQKEATARLSPL
jgi:hypothetical protein